MVNAQGSWVWHDSDVEITAAFVAFLGLVAVWLACPSKSSLVAEPSEDRRAA